MTRQLTGASQVDAYLNLKNKARDVLRKMEQRYDDLVKRHPNIAKDGPYFDYMMHARLIKIVACMEIGEQRELMAYLHGKEFKEFSR